MSQAVQGTQNGWGIVKSFLTKHGPLKKEMAIRSSIFAWRTPETVWKVKGLTLEDEPHRLEGIQQATEEEQRAITNSSRKNEVAGQKQKRHLAMDVSGGESKSDAVKNNIA